MSKKEWLIVFACAILFALLITLFVLEKKYPDGGAELLDLIRQRISG